MGEIVLRFLLGGAIVSLFAVLGEIFQPKTFAGVFGSAPSVALATLTLAFATDGARYVATEAQSMMIGALGLVVYGWACVVVTAHPIGEVWWSAALCWIAWAFVSFGLAALVQWLPPLA